MIEESHLPAGKRTAFEEGIEEGEQRQAESIARFWRLGWMWAKSQR